MILYFLVRASLLSLGFLGLVRVGWIEERERGEQARASSRVEASSSVLFLSCVLVRISVGRLVAVHNVVIMQEKTSQKLKEWEEK